MSKATAFHVISDSDLRENGGRFRLAKGGASKVAGFTDPDGVLPGKLTAAYIVTEGYPIKGGNPVFVTNTISVDSRGLGGGAAIPIYVENSDVWPLSLPEILCSISFQTDENGTFDPSIAKTGTVATWTIDGVEYVTNSPSATLIGDTVDVVLAVDDCDLVTQFIANDQGIVALPDLQEFPNLEVINMQDNATMTGSVADIFSLTGLTELHMGSTSVTGDASDFGVFSNVESIEFNNTSIAYGSNGGAGSWLSATNINFRDCAWSTAEVDRIVDDVHGSRFSWVGGAKVLDIGGTNGPPGIAATLQIVTLEASYGWNVIT